MFLCFRSLPQSLLYEHNLLFANYTDIVLLTKTIISKLALLNNKMIYGLCNQELLSIMFDYNLIILLWLIQISFGII